MFANLFSSINEKEISVIIGFLAQYAKKSGESVIFIVQKMLSMLKPAPGCISPEALAMMTSYFISVIVQKDSQLSSTVVSSVLSFLKIASDAGSMTFVCNAVMNSLLGSEGPLGYVYQRSGLLSVITSIAKMNPEQVAPAVEETIAKLATFEQKETNADVKRDLLCALGFWCARIPSAALIDPKFLPKPTQQASKAAPKPAPKGATPAKSAAPSSPTSLATLMLANPNYTSDDLKRAGQEALRIAVQGRKEELHPSIVAPLIALISASTAPNVPAGDKMKNPRLAPSGLTHAAATLLETFSANQASVDQKIIQGILSAGSVLFDPNFVSRLSIFEAESLLSVITSAFHQPQLIKESTKMIHISLISLALHPDRDVRRSSSQKIKELVKNVKGLSSELFEIFEMLIKIIYDMRTGVISATASASAPAPASASSSSKTQQQSLPNSDSQLILLCGNYDKTLTSKVLLGCLRTIVSLPEHFPIENVPRVFLLSHCTVLNESIEQRLRGDDISELIPPPEKALKFGSSTWGCLSKDLAGPGEGALLLQKVAVPVGKLLVSVLISSRETYLINAALCSINTMFLETPAEDLENISSLIAQNITDVISGMFSPRELEVSATPKGTLFIDDKANALLENFRSESSVSIERSQKRRGAGRLYSVDDEKWEAEVRKELESKKKSAATTPEGRVIANEDAIRSAVEDAMIPCLRSMLALRAMRYGSMPSCLAYFHYFIPALVSLIPHKVIGKIAYETYYSLGEAIPSNLVPPLVTQACAALTKKVIVERGRHKLMEHDEECFNSEMKVILMLAASCGCSGNNAIVSSGDINYGEVHTRAQPLPGQAFHYFFYAVRNAMEREYNTDTKHLHACSMKLLTSHTNTDSPIPRTQMVQVYIDVIDEKPRYARQACQALVPLFGGMTAQQMTSAIPGIIHKNLEVRVAILHAMTASPAMSFQPTTLVEAVQAALFVSLNDPEEEAKVAAQECWEVYKQPLGEGFFSLILPYLCHSELFVREMASESMGKALELFANPKTIEESVSSLIKTYDENEPAIFNGKSVFNENGELIEGDSDSVIETKNNARRGCISAIGAISSSLRLTPDLFKTIFDFLSRVASKNSSIQLMEVISSAIRVVDKNSKEHHSLLLPLLESYLSSTKDQRIQELTSLSLGTLAMCMDGEKFFIIVQHLLRTLLTSQSSAAVQTSIASCLSSIAKKIESLMDINSIIKTFFVAITSNSANERRGGANGIAGLVTGLGLSSLRKYGIFEQLYYNASHKKTQIKHGALLCFESLSKFLGRLFEPYIKIVIPKIVSAYSDASAEIRETAQESAKLIMSNLTIYGVRLIMPPLLDASRSDSWRVKKESIQMLGSMAYISPRHLSTCLPEIVPCLVSILTDSHYEVQEAAKKALRDIGEVINNPEILAIAPAIIKALEDPSESTGIALDYLEKTAFVHRIDPPSLSLIVPIAERGLKDRSTETKKKAASIIGSMCVLADPIDIRPYISFLMPAIKTIVVDQAPQIRAMAARALANLVRGLGGEQFQELLKWLQETMTSASVGTVERAGAAQALSEVYSVLEESQFKIFMEKLLDRKMHASRETSMREGVINIFRFFTTAMREQFELYLVRVLPIVLKGLSDESESVRESSNRAGSTIVNQYYNTSVKLLLPALENGLVDDNFRIQESSMELLETLLVKIVLGDQNVGAATIKDPDQILFKQVGFDAAASVISTLYIVRFDSNITVTQKAVSVWKIIVTNPPKMLHDTLKVLLGKILSFLCTNSEHLQEISRKALSDIVEKLDTKVIISFLPLVSETLFHHDPIKRCGALMGLTEVISSAERLRIQGNFVTEAVPSVKKGLCDGNEDVRLLAGEAFGALYRLAGSRAMGDIIQPLINGLHGPDAQQNLDALCQIVRVRGKVVLPLLLPTLYKVPVIMANAEALSKISTFAETSLPSVIGSTLERLISPLVSTPSPIKETLRKAAIDLCKASGRDGSTHVISVLYHLLKSDEVKPAEIQEVCFLLAEYCNANSDLVEPACEETVTVISILQALADLLCDPKVEIQTAALGALDSFMKTLDKSSPDYLGVLQKYIENLPERVRREPGSPLIVPGFTLPKGIAPILPLYVNAVGSGTPEEREVGALGIRDLFSFSTAEALGSFVITATGPLIRVMGDRFPGKVKAAFLDALSAIMEKGKDKLKPLVPQLQTTLIKALKNSEKVVRVSAIACLNKLMVLGVKPDLVVNDLISGIATNEPGVAESMFESLKKVFETPVVITPPVIEKAVNAAIAQIHNLSPETENSTRFSAASFLATATLKFPEPAVLISGLGMFSENANDLLLRSRQHFIAAVAVNQDLFNQLFSTLFLGVICADIESSDASVREDAANSIAAAFESLYSIIEHSRQLLAALGAHIRIEESSSDVCIAALNAVKALAKNEAVGGKNIIRQYASLVFTPIVKRLLKCIPPVKHAADYALFYSLATYDGNGDAIINGLEIEATDKAFLLDYHKKILYRLVIDEE
eukprot:TRINITY_DN2247_c4_g1_i1.p1 TRINITY_DN2247_c4_g1~~TRINITY_DN2247_c4_g1_i1.p1  ORF type:complete len:2784 (+),score=968.83 TRINITY_DN2247_c4_g1_i1:854-8353(+)